MAPSPTAVAAQPLWFLDDLVYVHVDGDQTGGEMSLVEFAARRGDMPPLHVDHRNDETVFLVEGRITFFVGDGEMALSEGQASVAPRGVPHAYRVESERARWLVINNPAGFERFLRAASEPAPDHELPPPGRALDPDAVVQLATEYGIEVLGPPGTLPQGTRR
jgi:mannose-6-phosphate isomerase-like protein (cupin superfamily)